MLHKETRILLLKSIETGTKVTDAAKAYCVNCSTVNRLIHHMDLIKRPLELNSSR